MHYKIEKDEINSLYYSAFDIQYKFFPTRSKKITKRNGTENWTEEYFVTKSKPSVQHGLYKKTNAKGKVITYGFYQNGKKDSTWIFMSDSGKDTLYVGKFKNDIPTGIWRVFRYGKLNFICNYDTHDTKYMTKIYNNQ